MIANRFTIPVTLLAALTLAACEPPVIDYTGPIAQWPVYGAVEGGGRYSPATQITPANVEHLEVAWQFHTGHWPEKKSGMVPSSFQLTPIVADGVMYVCTPFNEVIALDAETGGVKWRYDPQVDPTGGWLVVCRGVSTWVDPLRSDDSVCKRRIIAPTIDARLISLDAATGETCDDFGLNGELNLRKGVGDVKPGEYGVTSAPLIIEDMIVTGAFVLDNRRVDAPAGVIRAFDIRSGELRWAWDPIPPDRVAQVAAGEDPRFHRGTTNAWSTLSVDADLGLIYVPTGNTSPDYYGALREGLDYYSSSVVALEVATGKVRWSYQTVHHDVWDYDVPSQPTLFDMRTPDGKIVPALVQTTKMGFVFFLDRRTGEPIFPVEERPVPQTGGVPEEKLAATQPYPTKPPPIHPLELSPDEAFGITEWDREDCQRQIAALDNQGMYTPPSINGAVSYPAYSGGANWGSPAVDPERQIVVINTVRVAAGIKLIPRDQVDEAAAGGLIIEPQDGTPYAFVRWPLLSPIGIPCSPPPWGTLVAIDATEGEILWHIPIGSLRDMAPFPFWFEWGVPNKGGPIMTASGLVFLASTTDNFIRAFESETGAEVWKHRLPAGGQATPMTYRAGPRSKQFVVIAAGGHGLMNTTPGDSIVAFALPD
jgi:quinoprotein glucose dehydrogenase